MKKNANVKGYEANTTKFIRDKLMNDPKTKDIFTQSYNKPKERTEDMKKPDFKNDNSIKDSGFAFMCDYTTDAKDTLFKKGQVFCNPKTGEAFTCKDDLKCGGTKDPSDAKLTSKDKEKAEFTDVWEKVDVEKTKGKVFMAKDTQV